MSFSSSLLSVPAISLYRAIQRINLTLYLIKALHVGQGEIKTLLNERVTLNHPVPELEPLGEKHIFINRMKQPMCVCKEDTFTAQKHQEN